nr:protein KIAA0100-like [Zootoca vivipara]
MDLQKAPRLPSPEPPADGEVEQGRVLSLGPSLLRLLSQLCSVHVEAVNIMVLHAAASESLWHVQVTRTQVLLDGDGRRMACEVTFSQVNSKVLKSSRQVRRGGGGELRETPGVGDTCFCQFICKSVSGLPICRIRHSGVQH